MPVSTYTELQSEVANWLDREDLASKIPTFIRLFEAQAERKLRVRQMLVSNEQGVTPTTGLIVLPDNFLALQNLTIYDGSGRPMPITYASKGQTDQRRSDLVTAGFPRVYTISKNYIELAPRPDAEYQYELSYWERIPKLSGSNATNWLLDAHPDIYLFGALLQAEPYLKHDERVPLWNGALDSLLEDLTLADERAMRGGTPLKMRFKAYG